jgi:hypothetical protein
MCVEITWGGRLEKSPRGFAAGFTRVSSFFDVTQFIVDVEVRVVSVSCVARECLCAEAFSSDVTIKKKIDRFGRD